MRSSTFWVVVRGGVHFRTYHLVYPPQGQQLLFVTDRVTSCQVFANTFPRNKKTFIYKEYGVQTRHFKWTLRSLNYPKSLDSVRHKMPADQELAWVINNIRMSTQCNNASSPPRWDLSHVGYNFLSHLIGAFEILFRCDWTISITKL
jgi:hypothetical protein